MSVEAFYESFGGDLAGVRGRLVPDDRVEKFARMFMDDPTFDQLSQALAEQDLATAFRAAHTLKGTSREMGFTRLYEPANELAEALRPNDAGEPADPERAGELMSHVTEAYSQIASAGQLL